MMISNDHIFVIILLPLLLGTQFEYLNINITVLEELKGQYPNLEVMSALEDQQQKAAYPLSHIIALGSIYEEAKEEI